MVHCASGWQKGGLHPGNRLKQANRVSLVDDESEKKCGKRMLLANEPLERIALLTGLSLEEVKQEEKIVKSLLEKMDPVEVYDCLLL